MFFRRNGSGVERHLAATRRTPVGRLDVRASGLRVRGHSPARPRGPGHPKEDSQSLHRLQGSHGPQQRNPVEREEVS